MTVFKTSLPRSEAYWGITQSADFIDRLKLSVTKLTIPYKDILLDNMQLPAGTYFYQLQTKKR